jgi:enamine deaminase RidA (YjgF/YER057c/UK114 family)
MARIEARMRELGIALPAKALVGRANAIAWKRSGGLLFVSGQGPAWDAEIAITGRLGADLGLEEGRRAARLCALNILYHVSDALGGELDRVRGCLSVQAYVCCTDDFRDQPAVVNGASDLIVEIFGDAGRHTRTAIGSNSLPRGMPVEISAVWEVEGA